MTFFDLIDMRKVKPKNHVTGRWVLTIKTDIQGNVFKAKARWVLRVLQDTIFAKMITVLTRYRPIVFELM